MVGMQAARKLFSLLIATLAVASHIQHAVANSQVLDVGLVSWLPISAQVDWSEAGLPEGIPEVPVGANVVDFGAVPDDALDDSRAFQNAINAVKGTENNAITIPAGNYVLSKTLTIDDSVVLRGAGAQNTHITLAMPGNGIQVTKNDFGPWINLAQSSAFKATSLNLASTKGIGAGDLIELQQKNDKHLMYTSRKWNVPWAKMAVGQLLGVKNVSKNTVELSEPTNIAFSLELDAKVRRVNLVPWVGIEDLHFSRHPVPTKTGFSVFLKNTAYSWIRGVHSEDAVTNHIGAHRVYRCEIRDSYIHGSTDYGPGGNGYGVKLGYHVTGCLIENNIFHSLRHSMLLHLGANGNVLGHNYSFDSKNQTGNVLPDISVHGHYPFANLFESNIVEEIGFADYWGPVGPLNTAYRNCVTKEGIWLQDHSSSQLLIGNTVLEALENYVGFSDDSLIENILAIANEPADRIRLEQSSRIHSDGSEGYDIGASLYNMMKPEFYGSMPWPSTGNGFSQSCINPAKQRHENRIP